MSFGENDGKLQTVGSTSTTGVKPGTSRLPVLKRRTAQPLVGPRTGTVLTSMPYPGFEPGTFGKTAGFPNYCTAWSAFDVEKLYTYRPTSIRRISACYNAEWDVHINKTDTNYVCRGFSLFSSIGCKNGVTHIMC